MSDIDPRLHTAAALMEFTLPEVRQYLAHARRSLPGADDETLIEQAMDLMRRERQKRSLQRARGTFG